MEINDELDVDTLQIDLYKLSAWTKENKMKINNGKY